MARVSASQRNRRPESLEARIYAVYASLPPAEKRLADVLLMRQTDLPNRTAGALAAEARVSRSTAARLFQSLGYASYPSARRQVQADRHWGSPRAESPDASVAASPAATLRGMMEADISNVRATCEAVPAQVLADVTRILADARRIWIMGLRSGYGLAHHAAHYLSLLKDDVRVLPVGGGGLSHDVASFGPGDAVLVTAFRRRPRLLPTILEQARSAGASTVLLTDLSAGRSARAADHVLRCHCRTPAPFNSFAAAVVLLDYLAWSVAAALGDAGSVRFRRIDHLVELLDDVSTPLGRAYEDRPSVGRRSTRSS